MKPNEIVRMRESLGLSQEALARLLVVSFASVNRWENGHSVPSGPVLILLQALRLATKSTRSRHVVREAIARGDSGIVFWRCVLAEARE